MATSPGNRIDSLLHSLSLNGIDFVEVPTPGQPVLLVHFLNNVSLSGSVTSPRITGGETIPTVAVKPIDDATDWTSDSEGNPILRLTALAIGDFSFYTVSLASARLDPYYDTAVFSFRPNCDTTLDCDTPGAPCPPGPGNPPPIEYLAKDFLSFRQALLDFSALRYPEWQERAEGDFGMMFLEALAGMADDLSYTQDRVAAEATLQTATQRRSIVRQARLVDYEPRPATSATVQLQFNVAAGAVTMPVGVPVTGVTPDGQTVVFETGSGLADTNTYDVASQWNRPIYPYIWDNSQVCLKAKATAMWLAGHGLGLKVGLPLLIDTAQPPADPPIREVVHIVTVAEQTDELLGHPVTYFTWSTSEALQFDHDLTQTVVAGNLVPATQGTRSTESFAILTPTSGNPFLPLAIARSGPNSSPASFAPMYLHTLANTPLAWLAPDAATSPTPEIMLWAQPASSGLPVQWPWFVSLLHTEQFDAGFTLDRASYIPIATNSDGTTSYDYDGDSGDTIRFGDENFGTVPDPGTVFQAIYRTTSGAAGNLAADAITGFNSAGTTNIASVTNPFAAMGGADEESGLAVQRLAPQAFRANRYNAVLAGDYAAAAQTLPWVQRAGTVFRWTGSWLTVFTTADPAGSEQIPAGGQLQLIELLNRRRLAGYESYSPAPVYVSIDLQVYVCARPSVFKADVLAAVQSALSAAQNPDGTTGFFYVDNFTFGQPLERSTLEAAIQSAYGVAGVHDILYRQRGVIVRPIPLTDEFTVQPNQILRLDNDPNRPERGSLLVYVEGGK